MGSHRIEGADAAGASHNQSDAEASTRSSSSTVTTTVSVDIDQVMLQPGDWGTLPGVPVQRRLIEALRDMGIDSIRVGGTYVENQQENPQYSTGLSY